MAHLQPETERDGLHAVLEEPIATWLPDARIGLFEDDGRPPHVELGEGEGWRELLVFPDHGAFVNTNPQAYHCIDESTGLVENYPLLFIVKETTESLGLYSNCIFRPRPGLLDDLLVDDVDITTPRLQAFIRAILDCSMRMCRHVDLRAHPYATIIQRTRA